METRWVAGGDFASARGGGRCGAVGRARDAQCRRSVPQCRLWWAALDGGGAGLGWMRGKVLASLLVSRLRPGCRGFEQC